MLPGGHQKKRGKKSMKAIIKYKDYNTGNSRQKTIETDHNEPNYIIKKFAQITGINRATYISTIKCGRTEYQWHGIAKEAGV